MKTPKLEAYRDFIVAEANAETSINQICKKLGMKGCPVSRSYLKDWIEAAGIEFKTHKRGRPKVLPPQVFQLLPKAGEAAEFGPAQMALFTLQEGVNPDLMLGFRRQSLVALELPSYSTPPEQWNDLELFADLSDPELLFLAHLRSDLGGPPFSQGGQHVIDWYGKLVTRAMELREAIADATKARRNEGRGNAAKNGA